MNLKLILFTYALLTSLFFSAQSKQETITWLNNKLGPSPIILNGGEQMSKMLKINQNGSFTVTQTNEFRLIPSSNSTSFFSGNFQSLSPNSVKINNHDGYYYLYAACSSGKCITQDSRYRDGTERFNSNDVILGIVESDELAQRCKKAIMHLITLSKGKKEAF